MKKKLYHRQGSLNPLTGAKITTLGELANSTDERLREIPGFGRKSLEEVQKMLESLDLYLKKS
ncbi:hypothetical protein IKF89_02075 [Candidatus Saccharibacteria bacterium]|nr:hypothetical protein [Candidatus Saccharibacteria bacterium]